MIQRSLLAVSIGMAGGALFALLGIPLAWLMGAMFACMLAGFGKLPIAVPPQMRTLTVSVIGVALGSSFQAGIGTFPDHLVLSLLLMTVFLLGVSLVNYVVFLRVARLDRVTAMCSALPGGIGELVLLGSEVGGDTRKIALAHGTRLMIVVLTVPLIVPLFMQTGTAVPDASLNVVGDAAETSIISRLLNLAIIAAICILGTAAGTRLRLPMAAFIGSLFLSSLLHVAGLVDIERPPLLMHAAQCGLGVVLGCRFVGIEPASLSRLAVVSVLTTVGMIAAALAVAVLASRLTNLDGGVLALSYSPGGISEMGMVALAFNQDAALVTFHHLFRVVIILVVLAAIAPPLRARHIERGINPDQSNIGGGGDR